jgi:penicillin-binding protein 1C
LLGGEPVLGFNGPMKIPVQRFKKPFLYTALILAVLYLFLRLTPLPMEKLKGDYSTAFLASDGSLLRLTLSKTGKYRLPLKLEEVSPQVVRGFTAYEDRWFFWHFGVNPVALIRAAYLDMTHRKVVSGASTISMQVAKLLKRRPRTLWAKTVEIYRAMQLEARFSKKQILEYYLNSVPMGGNIEGVGAASLLYFGKPAKLLSWGETALLISLPRSPSGRRPDRFPQRAKVGRDEVLKRILPVIRLSELEAQGATQSILPTRRFANPNSAPQLAQRTFELSGRAPGVLNLTIQPNLQGLAQKFLSDAVAKIKNQGVHNGAIVILDNHTMKVLAYVGSPDFNDPMGGQINGANITRSPGSALKPFLYGLAMDRGLVTPRKMLFDIPRDYSGYKPANFEGKYQGLVSTEDALAGSLNIPAVGLESTLEAESGGLEAWIKQTGAIARGRGNLEPGLSVVLGAYPMTLEEMARLYATLANGGRMRTLKFFEDKAGADAPEKGKALLSPEACYMLSEMLAKVERTDLPASWEFSPTRSKVAFKTGTSFGRRDAWCVGYTPDTTIGVWLGNADNQGSAALIGHDAAAPVVINLFNELTRTKDTWFSRPAGVQTRKVCVLSGLPAGEECHDIVEDLFIPGVSDNNSCGVHRRVFIRKKDGREVCRYCMAGKPNEYYSKVFEAWPPDMTRFLRSRGQKFQAIPSHNQDCTHFFTRFTPHITSPKPQGKYEIQPGLPLKSQKVSFSVQAGPDVQEVYWFVGTHLVAQGKPDQVFYWNPQAGQWDVSVVDSRCRSDKVYIKVFEKAK